MDETPGRAEMKKRSRTLFLLLVLALAPAGAQERRLITENDLLKFVWIADPQISPDGTRIVFTRVVVNEKQDDYDTSLWIVPAAGGEEPRWLTSGGRDSSARWAPDSRRLAFVRVAERDGKPQPGQLYVLALDGGEARPLTDLPKGASAPVWSPDGKRIAFASTAKPDDKPEDTKPDAKPSDTKPSDKPGDTKPSDVRVITSAVYRANGSGWNDPDRPSHIWVADVTAGADVPKARQLTSGKYAESGAVWSGDSGRIFFTSARTDDPYYAPSDSDLYAVPAAGGEITRIASIDGTIGNVRLSADGQSIAFVGTLNGTPVRSYDQSDLFVATVDGAGAPRNLTAKFDSDINGGIGGDQAAPRGGSSRGPIWSSDGRSITIVVGERGEANLVRFDVASGTPGPVLEGEHAVQSYSSSGDGRRLVVLVSTQTNIGDLVSMEIGANGAALPAPRQITHVNEPLFKTLKLAVPEQISWASFDGKRIQGWLMHPPDFDRSKKYPLILEIHGGPHSAYGNTFTHEFQWMAAKGYVVLFPNPRGSSNYGQDFGNIIQYRYPADDYKDLMAGVDEVLKRGYIDEKRLGVTGGSGGGLLTNWTVTQTQRFAAAVSQRSIADWYGFWFTADFTLFTPTWFRKAPWEDPSDFTARSPITHVANVKTPLMLVDGDDDLRTPPSDGGEMMFRALKYLKVPTVMVRFPGETHELSRSGKPKHRVERLQHIVGWFDRWLMGKRDPRYETTAGR
jgi:dipeptidyl aminopeptidase/acylaminoacyl peptidase